MVETPTTTTSTIADEEVVSLKLPAAIISSVALFLPDVGKVRLAQVSHYFNQAMQWHFRLLLNQEAASLKR